MADEKKTREQLTEEAKERARQTRELPGEASHKRTNGGAIFKDDPQKGSPPKVGE